MSEDANEARLERLRGELSDMRERAAAVNAAEAPLHGENQATREDGDGLSSDERRTDRSAAAADETAEPPQAVAVVDAGTNPTNDIPAPTDDIPARQTPASMEDATPVLFSSRARGRRRRTIEVGQRPSSSASRPGTASEPTTGRFGRVRPPRPPRRNPIRRRAHKPPRRLAVPAPIPVAQRPSWVAAPRWPVVGWLAGTVIFVVLAPATAQLVWRLYVAMDRTSFLLGADPTRVDMLQAAAGVAGGGLTLAIALVALTIVRGRLGYLAAVGSVLVLFVGFPYMAYTANAGIVSAPLPTLPEMLQPIGWPRTAELQTAFVIAVAALIMALLDLLYRSGDALRRTAGGRTGAGE